MWTVTIQHYYDPDYYRELKFDSQDKARDFASLYDSNCDYYADIKPPHDVNRFFGVALLPTSQEQP